jgi:hypothetical protein
VLGQSLQHPSFIYPACSVRSVDGHLSLRGPLPGRRGVAGGAAGGTRRQHFAARPDAGSYLAEAQADGGARGADRRLAADLKGKSAEASRARADRGQDRHVPGGAHRAAVAAGAHVARFSAIAEAVFLPPSTICARSICRSNLQAITKYIAERQAQCEEGLRGQSEVKGLRTSSRTARCTSGQGALGAERAGNGRARSRDGRRRRCAPQQPATLDMETAMQELPASKRSADY